MDKLLLLRHAGKCCPGLAVKRSPIGIIAGTNSDCAIDEAECVGGLELDRDVNFRRPLD
jgi:hypothetical protein